MGIALMMGVSLLAGCSNPSAKTSEASGAANNTDTAGAESEKSAAGGAAVTLKFAYDDSEAQPYYKGIAAFKEKE